MHAATMLQLGRRSAGAAPRVAATAQDRQRTILPAASADSGHVVGGQVVALVGLPPPSRAPPAIRRDVELHGLSSPADLSVGPTSPAVSAARVVLASTARAAGRRSGRPDRTLHRPRTRAGQARRRPATDPAQAAHHPLATAMLCATAASGAEPCIRTSRTTSAQDETWDQSRRSRPRCHSKGRHHPSRSDPSALASLSERAAAARAGARVVDPSGRAAGMGWPDRAGARDHQLAALAAGWTPLGPLPAHAAGSGSVSALLAQSPHTATSRKLPGS
jgi:hypothetical protein